MKEVLSYLNKLLNDDDVVVVATSGGPDSMCLLHLLCDLKRDFKVVVAHVNHNLREESREEALFVKDFAFQHNLVYEYMEIKEYHNNVESDARKQRYDFFQSLVSKYNAKYLMTAHHGDDLLETILMRLTRGSSLKGYSGFLKITEYSSYSIVRPLISVTKKDILEYMDTNKYHYYVDKSNYSDLYTRNRYRKEVLPFLKKENANVHLKFLDFSSELYKACSFLDKYIREIIEDLKIDDGLDVRKLKNLDSFLLEKVIEYELDLFYNNDIALINKKHRDLIINFILNSKSNGFVLLPKNVKAIKDYNVFKFVSNEFCSEYKYEFNGEVHVPTGKIKQIKESDKKSNFIIRLNSCDITLPLIVRTRNDGDKMAVKNLNGSKKIKDIFIDEKISKEKRDVLPIVTDSENNILWIPGVKKSKFDVERDGIYDIILSYEEEIL